MIAASDPAARILVVDDEDANLRLLERLLRGAGHESLLVTDTSSEVLRIVESQPPDLILLDLHMPGLDGYEILELLRQMPQTPPIPVLVLTADITREARERALSLGARDFLTKPFDRTEVILRVRNLLEMGDLQRQLQQQNELLEQRVKDRTSDLWKALQSVENSEKGLRQSQAETVQRLAIAAEFRDDETARHIQRMSRYCGLLCDAAGLDAERCELIQIASVMHDVGKIGIPDAILLKPGPLTPEERLAMQEHSRIGHQILAGSDSELLQMAARIALSHHERFEGGGYPEGISGEAIPLEARIAAIADVFDAISTDRVYRKALPFPTVVSLMRAGRGTQFDPEILDLFFDRFDDILKIKEEFEEAA